MTTNDGGPAMWGMAVHIVDPGTVLEGPDGIAVTVTDTEAAVMGRVIWVTPNQAAALKSASRKETDDAR
jgi:hypothetical protein